MVVRSLRKEVVMKRNDLAALEGRLESALAALHALGPAALGGGAVLRDGGRGAGGGGRGASGSPAADGAGDEDGNLPFALVDAVSPDSPAAAAGIRAGDRLVALGELRVASRRGGHPAEESGRDVALPPSGEGGAGMEGQRAGQGAASAAWPTLADVAALVRSSEGRTLPVVVLRQKEPGAGSGSSGGGSSSTTTLRLSLTPARWAGPGLLGCHVLPLQQA
jgi:hypothetical protein